jgi:superfamily I DNA/RNA helicase
MIEMPEYNFNGPGMAPFSRDIENFWYKLSRIILTEASPRMYLRRLRWANEVLKDLVDSGYNVDGINHKTILRTCNGITIEETNGLDYLQSFFETFLDELNIDLATNISLTESFTSFFDSSRKRIDRIKKEGNSFIEHIDSFKKVFQQKDGTTISTIHGVKGAEFDTVIAFGLLEGYVPHSRDANGDETANRLLYVIGSRARKNLHLISETGRKNWKNVPYLPTNVLSQIIHQYDEL